jgi:hypothetical protein
MHPILRSSYHDPIHEKARWTMSTPAPFRGSDRGKLTATWAHKCPSYCFTVPK